MKKTTNDTPRELRKAQSPAASASNTGQPAGAAGDAKQWQEHEHQADRVELQAKQLIAEAGSPDLAKHAIDLATPGNERAPDVDAPAREFGFESYAMLYEASQRLPGRGEETWRIVAFASGQWVAWKQDRWPDHLVFDSYEQAAMTVHDGSPPPPEP